MRLQPQLRSTARKQAVAVFNAIIIGYRFLKDTFTVLLLYLPQKPILRTPTVTVWTHSLRVVGVNQVQLMCTIYTPLPEDWTAGLAVGGTCLYGIVFQLHQKYFLKLYMYQFKCVF